MPFRLADAIFLISVACCVIAQMAILRSVLRTPTAVQSGASATTSSSSRRATEIAWAVIPGIALAALLVFTWRAMR